MSEEVEVEVTEVVEPKCDEHCLCQKDTDLIPREGEDHVESRSRQVIETKDVHPDIMVVDKVEEEPKTDLDVDGQPVEPKPETPPKEVEGEKETDLPKVD